MATEHTYKLSVTLSNDTVLEAGTFTVKDGEAGATGPAGLTGATGPAGANGKDGAQGPQGVSVTAVTLTEV